MAYLEIIFLVCYFVVLVFLSLYGLHRYVTPIQKKPDFVARLHLTLTACHGRNGLS